MTGDLKLGTVTGLSITGRALVKLDGAADAIAMSRAKGLTVSAGDRVLCAYISGVYIVMLAILQGGVDNGNQ